eukprot:2205007-Amphidinium_carterae.1
MERFGHIIGYFTFVPTATSFGIDLKVDIGASRRGLSFNEMDYVKGIYVNMGDVVDWGFAKGAFLRKDFMSKSVLVIGAL